MLHGSDRVISGSRIAELVEYQEGSVVSKTLVKKTAGTVTLFAFDRGQGLSEHTAPFDAIVHIIDGKVEVTVSGRSFTLEAGEIAILPAGEPHAVQAVDRFKMLLTMIRS
jgi:quercetin dioxygenase-like cupin family protein